MARGKFPQMISSIFGVKFGSIMRNLERDYEFYLNSFHFMILKIIQIKATILVIRLPLFIKINI